MLDWVVDELFWFNDLLLRLVRDVVVEVIVDVIVGSWVVDDVIGKV